MLMPTLTASPQRLRSNVLRRIAYVVIVLLLAAAVPVVWLVYTTKSSLPQLDGTITVLGLPGEATILRDTHGVPHIEAADINSLLFTQGYVTAQDRLWQMDMLRRYSAGEAAEILGKPLLEHDRQQRVLQIRHAVEAAFAVMPAADRQYLDVYSKGVNAFLDSHLDNLPLEFRVLRYKPRRWRPEDSLLVGANMNQFLNTQYDTELAREKILAKLPAALADDLYPNSSWRDHVPGGEASLESNPSSSDAADSKKTSQLVDSKDRLLAPRLSNPDLSNPAPPVRHLRVEEASPFGPHPWNDCPDCVPGSNNWVVSGAHTESGKPMLSNDMHLGHQIPNTWYEAHLHSGAFNVAGVTIPGVPFVIVGHNERIAWGFTNLGPDVQDIYVENVNGRGEYQAPRGWIPLEHRKETIKVKGQADEVLDVPVSRHGPIITSIVDGETRSIALRWTLYDPALLTAPFFDVDSAQNWQEFRSAFSKFGGPSQNVVYGDIDGHIGYQATGKIPIRAAGDGLTPVSGADDAHEWTGYVPFNELPSVFDPPGGILASANSRITPDNYRYMLSNQWVPPYRTQRIYQVLSAKPKLTREDMLALQTDVYSDVERYFANQFVYAVDHSPKASERARKASEIMRGWDGRLTIDSAAPTIRAFSRYNLWKLLLQPKLGNDWVQYRWEGSTLAAENLVSRRPQRWLPPGYANWDELLTAAVEETVRGKQAPQDLTTWKYGHQFPIQLSHPIFGEIPFLRRWAGPGTQPQSGGGSTVKQVGRAFGPSERMTVDFSDLDHSTLNIVAGESGQIFSRHFLDHWPAWYGGTTFTLPFSRQAIANDQEHSLKLMPVR